MLFIKKLISVMYIQHSDRPTKVRVSPVIQILAFLAPPTRLGLQLKEGKGLNVVQNF